MDAGLYDALARLFTYPDESFSADLDRAIRLLEENGLDRSGSLRRFRDLIPLEDATTLRELHTRTFDVQAIATLDLGYTLFGEDYKRGALLANLSHEHARVGNDCGGELGDHLTNVLRLLPRLADEGLRRDLARVLVIPALRETIAEFEPDRLAKKEALYKKHHKTVIAFAEGETRTAWRHALEAVLVALEEEFGIEPTRSPGAESRFARSVGAELGIEGGDGRTAEA